MVKNNGKGIEKNRDGECFIEMQLCIPGMHDVDDMAKASWSRGLAVVRGGRKREEMAMLHQIYFPTDSSNG